MVGGRTLVAFIAATESERSHAFYGGVLQLERIEATPFANVYDDHGTHLQVTIVPHIRPAPYTVLGWEVDDITSAVTALTGRGVRFNRYCALSQDDHAIWTAPEGARIAWFADPDGNILSLTEPAPRR
jgi:catechol 2,3-dioxygenase-like lactoylglutathione lyase family enzyme